MQLEHTLLVCEHMAAEPILMSQSGSDIGVSEDYILLGCGVM